VSPVPPDAKCVSPVPSDSCRCNPRRNLLSSRSTEAQHASAQHFASARCSPGASCAAAARRAEWGLRHSSGRRNPLRCPLAKTFNLQPPMPRLERRQASASHDPILSSSSTISTRLVNVSLFLCFYSHQCPSVIPSFIAAFIVCTRDISSSSEHHLIHQHHRHTAECVFVILFCYSICIIIN
jgi:hypothetical protein